MHIQHRLGFVPKQIEKEMEERTNWGNLLAPAKLENRPEQQGMNRLRPDW